MIPTLPLSYQLCFIYLFFFSKKGLVSFLEDSSLDEAIMKEETLRHILG